MAKYSVQLSKIAKQLNLNLIYEDDEIEDVAISTAEVNRPGLFLAGYDTFFDPGRVQILGKAEFGYLNSLEPEKADEIIERLFSKKPPVIIVTRGRTVTDIFLECSKKYHVPLLRSQETASSLMSGLLSLLNVELAERITRHGVLVEVYGEGILIMGDSGVGKSETAVELVKRGHRLIADDAVELRKVSNRTIFGQAPSNIRHFIELRGIGIINVARVFGTGAVKDTQTVNLVVELEQWDRDKNYTRTGLEDTKIDIMGLRLPLTVIPVMPGRNLAVILEIAAINNRQKGMGYYGAKDLLSKLGLKNDITDEDTPDQVLK